MSRVVLWYEEHVYHMVLWYEEHIQHMVLWYEEHNFILCEPARTFDMPNGRLEKGSVMRLGFRV